MGVGDKTVKNTTFAALLVVVACAFVFAQDQKQPADGKVVLRVNEQEVTAADFQALLAEHKARDFMEELVDLLLIRQAAKKAGVTVSDAEVDKRQEDLLLQELALYDNDFKKMEEELQRYGYTLEDRRRSNAHKTRLLLLAEKLVKSERTAEESVKSLFKERYPKTAGTVAKVYHVLISTDEVHRYISNRMSQLKLKLRIASAAQKEKISEEIAGLKEKAKKWESLSSRKVADEIVKKLRGGGKFAELAREYGAGYTAENFDMGWVTRQGVFELLVPAVFDRLKPGEVAEPIQSRFGFHVVKLLGLKEVSELKYEDVRPYLLDELETRAVNNHEIRHLVIELREKAKIERPGLRNGKIEEPRER